MYNLSSVFGLLNWKDGVAFTEIGGIREEQPCRDVETGVQF